MFKVKDLFSQLDIIKVKEWNLLMKKSYIHVRMMDKHVKCGQDFTNSLHRGRWVFVPTQVDHYPRHIPEKSDWDVWTDKGQQGLHHTQLNDIIS